MDAKNGKVSAAVKEKAPFAALAAVFFALYCLTSSRSFSYDSITHALSVEFGAVSWLFHPNHLLHTPVGKLAFLLTSAFDGPRAIYVLQWINAAAAAAGLGAWAVLLSPRYGTARACLAAAALGTSFAFWGEAADPGAYAWAALFACALAWPLTDTTGKLPAARGALLGAAALFHQMFALAAPALLRGLGARGKTRLLAALVVTAGLPYAAVMLAWHSGSLYEALLWLFGPSGGRPGSGVFQSSWWTTDFAGAIAAMAAAPLTSWLETSGNLPRAAQICGGVFLWAGWAALCARAWRRGDAASRTLLERVFLWLVFFSLFQFFWLPGSPRFILLSAPAAILALLESGLPGRGFRRAAAWAAVAAAALLNLGPAMHRARQGNNPDFVRLEWVRGSLASKDFLLFSGGSGSITNVYVAYFAPGIPARSMYGYLFGHPSGDFSELDAAIAAARAAGKKVWVEASLLDPAARAALAAATGVPQEKIAAWLQKLRPGRVLRGPLGFDLFLAEERRPPTSFSSSSR